MKKVSRGQAFKPQASAWNAFVDAALAHKQSGSNGRGSETRSAASPAVVLVKNNTGAALGRYRAAKLTTSSVLPTTENAPEFLNRIVITADMPDSDSAGRWGITQVGLSADALGPAAVAGVTQAWINLSNAAHTCVEAVAASTVPASGWIGSARILWVAGGVGTATATGEQWAIISLGQAPQRVVSVTVSNTGGAAGGSGANCSFVYEVQLKGVVIGTDQTPVRPRLTNIPYTAAPADSPGLASLAADGSIEWVDVFKEAPANGACGA